MRVTANGWELQHTGWGFTAHRMGQNKSRRCCQKMWEHFWSKYLPLMLLKTPKRVEQSATVWYSSLTKENSDDIERVKKSAIKIIMGSSFKSYMKSFEILDLDTLSERRILQNHMSRIQN